MGSWNTRWDQAQTDMVSMPGPWGDSYLGFCAGLAFRWCWLRYGDADYNYDPQTREMDTPDWQVTREQMVYGEVLAARRDFKAAYDAALRPYNMTVNNGQVTERGAASNSNLLTMAALSGGPGCYIITMHREGGGHALAMQNEDGRRFRFFDANYGEFVLRGTQGFSRFLDWFLVESGYGRKYVAGRRVVGLNAPPAGAYDRF